MVAVYLVVAFHARLAGFAGGFVGVDVFFVLSGYLVTSILLRDLATAGRVDLRRFYARRFRRILPAAAVALLVTELRPRSSPIRREMLDALGGFRLTFLYVANWHFISQATDYFAAGRFREPGAAPLVAGRRGAVLLRVAAPAERSLPRVLPPARR